MKKMVLLLAVVAAAVLFVPGGTGTPTHTVVRGDTLGVLAQQHGLTVAELRALNGLSGDLIEVGQVLKLGTGGPAPRDRLMAWLRPEPEVEAPPEAVAAESTRRPPARKGTRAPRAGAEEPPPTDEPEAPSYAPLGRPPPKACLDDTTVAGASMARSVGLEPDQISAAVRGFQGQTLRCFGEKDLSGTVWLDLVVGCDGRVRRSALDRHNTGDTEFALCVADAMSYAPFPPHARDEVEFSVPLVFTAP